MMISPELADALKLNPTSNANFDEDDSISFCGSSIPATAAGAVDDTNTGLIIVNALDTTDNDGVLECNYNLNLDDYEPPASLLMAVMEAERQMDEVISSFSSDGSASEMEEAEPNVVAVETPPISTTTTPPAATAASSKDDKEFICFEKLSYSQVKRMAFSPLEAPSTVDKGPIKGRGDADIVIKDEEPDLAELEAFLPNNNNNNRNNTHNTANSTPIDSNILSSSSSPPTAVANPSTTSFSPSPPSSSSSLAKRRMEALRKHKERTRKYSNKQQQPFTTTTAATNTVKTASQQQQQQPSFTSKTTNSNKSSNNKNITSNSITTTEPPMKHQHILQQSRKQFPNLTTVTKTNTTKITTSTSNLKQPSTTTTTTTNTNNRSLKSPTKPISPHFMTTARLGKPPQKLPLQKQEQPQQSLSTKSKVSSIPISQHTQQAPRPSSSGSNTNYSKPSTTRATTTRPISPNFMTTARLGKPPQQKTPPSAVAAASSPKENPKYHTMKTPKLTIPRPPRLSTTERHGEKVYSTTIAHHNNSNDANPTGETSNYNRSADNSVTSLNNNKALLFMSDTKSAIVLPPHVVNMLRDHGTNNGCGSNANTASPSSNPKRRREPLAVTVPITPVVLKRPTSRSSRKTCTQNEISTQEKREREEIAYIASHQFKARPMPNLSCPTTAVTPSTSRRASPQKSSAELRKSTIAPIPPLLSADEIELAKKFKARPLPKFLTKTTTQPSTKTSPKKIHDPDFASRPKIISIPRGPINAKVVTASTRVIRDLHKPLTSSGSSIDNATPKPTSPKPFTLLSEMRGMMHQEQLQERIRLEEQQREDVARSFKARPAPKFSIRNSKTPSRRHSTTPLTEPREFRLQTEVRHELHQAELESKIEAMETRRILESVVKPLPIPKTLYTPNFKPVMPSELGREPIHGSAPHLETTEQSKRRQSFDQEAKERRDKEEKIKKLMQHEEELETDREIRELRQLPANEGGFNPVINTSFLKLRGARNARPAILNFHQ